MYLPNRNLHSSQDSSTEQAEQVYQAPGLDYSLQNRRDQPNSSSVYNPHMISQHIPPPQSNVRAAEATPNSVQYGQFEPTPSPIQ